MRYVPKDLRSRQLERDIDRFRLVQRLASGGAGSFGNLFYLVHDGAGSGCCIYRAGTEPKDFGWYAWFRCRCDDCRQLLVVIGASY